MNMIVEGISNSEIGDPIRIEPRTVGRIAINFTGITAAEVKLQILQPAFRDGITTVGIECLVRNVCLPVTFLAVQLILGGLNGIGQFWIFHFFHLSDFGIVKSVTQSKSEGW